MNIIKCGSVTKVVGAVAAALAASSHGGYPAAPPNLRRSSAPHRELQQAPPGDGPSPSSASAPPQSSSEPSPPPNTWLSIIDSSGAQQTSPSFSFEKTQELSLVINDVNLVIKKIKDGNIELIKEIAKLSPEFFKKPLNKESGDTALHYAAYYGQDKLIDFFIEKYPALLDMKKKDGASYFDVAMPNSGLHNLTLSSISNDPALIVNKLNQDALDLEEFLPSIIKNHPMLLNAVFPEPESKAESYITVGEYILKSMFQRPFITNNLRLIAHEILSVLDGQVIGELMYFNPRATPLMEAARTPNIEAVKILLQYDIYLQEIAMGFKGQNPWEFDSGKKGKTAIEWAMHYGDDQDIRAEIVSLISETRRVPANQETEDGFTILFSVVNLFLHTNLHKIKCLDCLDSYKKAIENLMLSGGDFNTPMSGKVYSSYTGLTTMQRAIKFPRNPEGLFTALLSSPNLKSKDIYLKDIFKGVCHRRNNVTYLYSKSLDIILFLLWKKTALLSKELKQEYNNYQDDESKKPFKDIITAIFLVGLVSDFFICKPIVHKNGRLLRYMPQNIRDNKMVALAAVENNGEALQYASVNLRDNDAVVQAAVKNTPSSLRFASIRLQSHPSFIKMANDEVKKRIAAIEYQYHGHELFMRRALLAKIMEFAKIESPT